MSSRDLVVAAAGASAPSDPNFKNVSLLLSGDGTNGAQNNTFLDSSTNNFTITRNGNTTQGTFSPYGNLWSNYFDGSGDSLVLPSNAAFGFGTGDFTIECWAFATSSGDRDLVTFSDDIQNVGIYSGNFYYFQGSGSLRNIGTAVLNQWNHIAISRKSGTVECYVNGVRGFTGSDTINTSTRVARIGTNYNGTTSYWLGYISNVRIIKGTGLYTGATITVPTTPLTAVSGTSLLTCQSNRFIDNSSNNFTLTVNGNTSVQRFSPFNPTSPYSASTIGGSGYFDGTGDNLNAGTNTAFAFGTGAFTMEAWIYDTGTTANYGMIIASDTYGSSTNVAVYLNGSTKKVHYYSGSSGGAAFSSSNTITSNSWNHIAAVKSGTTVTLYLNGVSNGSASDTSNIPSTIPMCIGGTSNLNADGMFKGYISNVRIVKGSAVYTTTFTPPTSPLTAVSGTSLLCNFTNAGIPDAAMMNDLETVGNAQVSTSVKKYGTGSLAFDGSGDYLPLPSNPSIAFGTGDFTIEFWMNTNNSDGSQRGLLQTSDTVGGFKSTYTSGVVIIQNSNAAGALLNGGMAAVVAGITFGTNTSVVSIGTWSHIALVRASGVSTLYVNGTSVGSATTTGNCVGQNLVIGGFVSTAFIYNGYIDDLRITKGLARYPTEPFPTAALPTY